MWRHPTATASHPRLRLPLGLLGLLLRRRELGAQFREPVPVERRVQEAGDHVGSRLALGLCGVSPHFPQPAEGGGVEAGGAEGVRAVEQGLSLGNCGLGAGEALLRGAGAALGLGRALLCITRLTFGLPAAGLDVPEFAPDFPESGGCLGRRTGQGGAERPLAPGVPVEDGLGVPLPVQGREQLLLDDVG